MTKNTFLAEFKHCGGMALPNGWTLFRKPLELWNERTGESRLYKTYEDALGADIGGMTAMDYIESVDVSALRTVRLD